MFEHRVVFMGGEYVPWKQAQVHIMSHSFARGSAIFEVLSLHDTTLGPSVFRLDQHLMRLFRSAELLEMQVPMTQQALHEAVCKTVKRNGLRKGFIKIVCYFPQIAFEILPPQNELDVSIFALDPEEDMGGLKFPFEQGTSACLSRWRKLDPQTVPIEAKAAANYLNGMMARAEAKRRGFENVIMLDTQGFIAEGGTESVFLVKDGIIMTPALGTVLPSITRKSILEVAGSEGIRTHEGRLGPELLFEADEVFFSGTPLKVLPVRKLEGRVMEGIPGPVTRRLSLLMERIVARREPRFRDWLFPVE